MNMLLAFAPFVVFALTERLAGPTLGLFAAALVSAGLLLRDWLNPAKSVKALEVGTAILFGSLAVYTLFAKTPWSIVGVRLCVDAGLLLIVLLSILLQRPFTLQYAREQVPLEVLGTPGFVRTNYIITAAWAIAFAVMVGADLLLLREPNLPAKVAVGATILAIVGAVKFTGWYTDRVRSEAQAR